MQGSQGMQMSKNPIGDCDRSKITGKFVVHFAWFISSFYLYVQDRFIKYLSKVACNAINDEDGLDVDPHAECDDSVLCGFI